MPESRPPVTVVLPFYGSRAEADAAVERLATLRLSSGDRALLVDNTEGGIAAGSTAPGVEVVSSPVAGSAYAARNVGVEAAGTDWILFIDADCRPVPDLLDLYWAPPPSPSTGLVAGGIAGTPGQPGVIPAYARSRRHLDQSLLQRHPYRPMAVTANLLVRRDAWADVGGFAERTRSGADADFCWRMLDAGWRMELRERAAVTHDHRASLGALLAQARRDGAGGRWLARRHAGYRPAITPRAFGRALAGGLAWPLLGQLRRGLFKTIDGVWGVAFDLGMLESNAPVGDGGAPAGLVALVEEFPRRGDPLPAALAAEVAAGRPVVVEARRRPERQGWPGARALPTQLWEDDAPLERIRAAGRLLLRGRRLAPEEAPVALRLRAAAEGALVLAEPELLDIAHRLVAAAGRPDLRVQEIGDGRGRLPGAPTATAGIGT